MMELKIISEINISFFYVLNGYLPSPEKLKEALAIVISSPTTVKSKVKITLRNETIVQGIIIN